MLNSRIDQGGRGLAAHLIREAGSLQGKRIVAFAFNAPYFLGRD
jgi:hypothetical protein